MREGFHKIQQLIDEYGKDAIQGVILDQSQNGITIQVGNRTRLALGIQNQKYVTEHTILTDLQRIGIPLDKFEKLLKARKEKADARIPAQSESKPKPKVFRPTRDIFAEKWYEGGTLHFATVAQWRVAAHANKIATAADWVASSRIGKDVFRKTGDIDSLKPYVLELIICVDEAAGAKGAANMKIAEIAAGCIILMGYN